MTTEKYEIHLVSHTHWDREWYDTFENFRARLVKLVDRLLAIMESDKNFRYFVLDGQTVVLEDYLQIKPENRELLRKYIKQGRILVGPWYVLPDEFLESGEAMVRNLLLGHKIAKDFGRVMKVGYVPDPFGHISQLPQILRGFDIDSFIFTRGLGGEGEKLGSEFYWLAPDGSQVLAVRQAAWYGDSVELGKEPVDLKKALEIINRSKAILSKYARTKYLLSNNGEDHQEPQPEIPKIIEYLNGHLDDVVVTHSNFEEFIGKLKSADPKLEFFEGELRGTRYAQLLPGVMSTRMYLKQENERTQTRLEKIVEPLAALSWLGGAEYPQEALERAWKYLLQCHPHDSICGCSIDEVHREVMERFLKSQETLTGVLMEAVQFFVKNIDRTNPDLSYQPIVVINTLNWKRTDVVKPINSKGKHYSDFLVLDGQGSEVPARLDSVGRIEFLAKDVPPYGYKVYYLAPKAGKRNYCSGLIAEKCAIENEYYRVKANSNGTIAIHDKTSGAVLDGILIFEDIEDAGDEYNFSPAKNSQKLDTKNEKAKISIEELSQLAATLKIEIGWKLPVSLKQDRGSRNKKAVKCLVETFITLHSGIKRIDFRTVFDNKAEDHRLRVLFPTDIKTEHCFSEGQFDVVKRKVGFPPAESSVEAPCPTYPQQSFLSASDNKKGLTLINQGLPEYEAIPEKDGICFALTLLRCVGWLSRDDFSTRRGHAGPQMATPEAQCQGLQEFRYSLFLHGGDWQKNRIWQEAYNHNV
ncbi:MAG: hypothetical protein HYW69_03250, partial [Candidatus Nealsonbacteria bacterium]|nr:hypothetical protein [Candidatus Nealsonbacteria bacterium]